MEPQSFQTEAVIAWFSVPTEYHVGFCLQFESQESKPVRYQVRGLGSLPGPAYTQASKWGGVRSALMVPNGVVGAVNPAGNMFFF